MDKSNITTVTKLPPRIPRTDDDSGPQTVCVQRTREQVMPAPPFRGAVQRGRPRLDTCLSRHQSLGRKNDSEPQAGTTEQASTSPPDPKRSRVRTKITPPSDHNPLTMGTSESPATTSGDETEYEEKEEKIKSPENNDDNASLGSILSMGSAEVAEVVVVAEPDEEYDDDDESSVDSPMSASPYSPPPSDPEAPEDKIVVVQPPYDLPERMRAGGGGGGGASTSRPIPVPRIRMSLLTDKEKNKMLHNMMHEQLSKELRIIVKTQTDQPKPVPAPTRLGCEMKEEVVDEENFPSDSGHAPKGIVIEETFSVSYFNALGPKVIVQRFEDAYQYYLLKDDDEEYFQYY